MATSAIITLLQTALLLIATVQANPNVPPALRDTATTIAMQAIAEATKALAAPPPATSPMPTPSSAPSVSHQPVVTGPQILAFKSEKSAGDIGDTVTLTWEATNATECLVTRDPSSVRFPLNGFLPSGTRSLTLVREDPTKTAPQVLRYSLVCGDKDSNTVVQTISITVNAPRFNGFPQVLYANRIMVMASFANATAYRLACATADGRSFDIVRTSRELDVTGLVERGGYYNCTMTLGDMYPGSNNVFIESATKGTFGIEAPRP